MEGSASTGAVGGITAGDGVGVRVSGSGIYRITVCGEHSGGGVLWGAAGSVGASGIGNVWAKDIWAHVQFANSQSPIGLLPLFQLAGRHLVRLRGSQGWLNHVRGYTLLSHRVPGHGCRIWAWLHS